MIIYTKYQMSFKVFKEYIFFLKVVLLWLLNR